MTKVEEIKNWYNQRHIAFGEHAWRTFEAYPVFLDYLNAKTGKKLLDIGCGTGFLLKAADKRGLETYGVDISEEGVKVAKKTSPNSKIIVERGEDLKFPDNLFDYVTCLGALEHFLDMEKSVQKMVKIGKDNASYCIVVPNVNFILWKIKGSKGTEQQDINENLLSLHQWQDFFDKEGLEVTKVYQDKWFMKKTKVFSSFNPLGIIKRAIYKLAWVFLPLKYTYQFVFLLKKKK